ncbi:hypothetical protein [Streptomyces niveus]|uniref:hypothetical protein n=1 Tax=Streptomyces niveus TaxID=193462 RepID=UPI003659F64F
MNEYTAVCETSGSETLSVSDAPFRRVALNYGDSEADKYGSVYLSPGKARELAAAIVAKADELDGSTRSEAAVKVGDRFRVTERRLECADVEVCEIVAVEQVAVNGYDDFRARSATTDRLWRFDLENVGNGLERVDEEPLADWERDLLNSASSAASSASVFPERVALLNEANKHIGQPARADDVLAVARFLAGE